MKNIIKKIQKRDDILIFICVFMITLGIGLNIGISSNDEIWNFQNVYKMYNGYTIYEDINVIITPLFFWCAEFIFHIFGANLLIFRISHGFLMAILFLITYKLLKKLELPKSISALTVFFMCIQEFFLLIRTSFNYNNMALLLFVIGIYFLINEKTRKNTFIQVIITTLIILTKQNIGIYYGVATVLYMIISNRTLKNKIKDNLRYISWLLITIAIFVIYLLIDNNLYPFLDYTFGGLFEFANENVNIDISGTIYMISLVGINIGISIFFIKKNYFSEDKKENIKILFVFSMLLLLVCYPIFNWSHILIGTYLTVINVVFIMYTVLKDFREIISKISKIANSILVLGMVTFSIFNIYMCIYSITQENYPYFWKDPFFGGIINQESYEENEDIIKYIENNEKNVVVLSNKAALYMIPLNRNNGDFDLIFKGNFGFKGEDGVIDKVDEMKNTQFLISKEENEHVYQESVKIKNHVKKTKRYAGEIGEFVIYE